jgi:hypothetical protein
MIITESGKFRKGHHASGFLQLTESARLVSVADLRDRSLRGPASPAQYGVAGEDNDVTVFSCYGSVDILPRLCTQHNFKKIEAGARWSSAWKSGYIE